MATNYLKINEDGSVNVVIDKAIAIGDVQLKGSIVEQGMSVFVTGKKTVTATAAAMFAGTAPLANRYKMIVHNTSANTVYWGATGVTIETGFPLLPNDVVHFRFEIGTPLVIYFIADGEFTVGVVESA